jgi:DNA-binding MarR family transcriptional regulator
MKPINTHEEAITIVSLMNHIQSYLEQAFKRKAQQYHISELQLKILIYLGLHKHLSINVTQVADYLQLTKATVSVSLKVLAEKQLIVIEELDSDKRTKWIALSEEGNTIAEQGQFYAQPLLNTIALIKPQYLDTLKNTLQGVVNKLAAHHQTDSYED